MSASPITIVIPVFNRAHTLPRLLRSIDAQTLAPAAVVLVDNASTDTSMQVMGVWARGRRDVTILSQPRPGAPAARNLGLAAVRTEWTMFFDSDDEMTPTHIAGLTAAISANPDAGIVGKDIIIRRDGHDSLKGFDISRPMFMHIFRTSLSTQRYVARTELFRAAGGWDESLPGWDDLELGVRLLLLSPVMTKAPGEPGAIVHFQSESITGESFSARPGAWEKSLDAMREDLLRAGRHEAIDWVDAKAMILAASYRREGSRGLARRLHDRVMARTPHRWRMRLIYLHNLIFRRLTWLLAGAIFPGRKY